MWFKRLLRGPPASLEMVARVGFWPIADIHYFVQIGQG